MGAAIQDAVTGNVFAQFLSDLGRTCAVPAPPVHPRAARDVTPPPPLPVPPGAPPPPDGEWVPPAQVMRECALRRRMPYPLGYSPAHAAHSTLARERFASAPDDGHARADHVSLVETRDLPDDYGTSEGWVACAALPRVAAEAHYPDGSGTRIYRQVG